MAAVATPQELVRALDQLKKDENRIEWMRTKMRLGENPAIETPDDRPRLARILFPREPKLEPLSYAEATDFYEFLNQKLDLTRRKITAIEEVVNAPIETEEN